MSDSLAMQALPCECGHPESDHRWDSQRVPGLSTAAACAWRVRKERVNDSPYVDFDECRCRQYSPSRAEAPERSEAPKALCTFPGCGKPEDDVRHDHLSSRVGCSGKHEKCLACHFFRTEPFQGGVDALPAVAAPLGMDANLDATDHIGCSGIDVTDAQAERVARAIVGISDGTTWDRLDPWDRSNYILNTRIEMRSALNRHAEPERSDAPTPPKGEA